MNKLTFRNCAFRNYIINNGRLIVLIYNWGASIVHWVRHSVSDPGVSHCLSSTLRGTETDSMNFRKGFRAQLMLTGSASRLFLHPTFTITPAGLHNIDCAKL